LEDVSKMTHTVLNGTLNSTNYLSLYPSAYAAGTDLPFVNFMLMRLTQQ